MEITESILTSIKKLLGIDAEYKHFNRQIREFEWRLVVAADPV